MADIDVKSASTELNFPSKFSSRRNSCVCGHFGNGVLKNHYNNPPRTGNLPPWFDDLNVSDFYIGRCFPLAPLHLSRIQPHNIRSLHSFFFLPSFCLFYYSMFFFFSLPPLNTLPQASNSMETSLQMLATNSSMQHAKNRQRQGLESTSSIPKGEE